MHGRTRRLLSIFGLLTLAFTLVTSAFAAPPEFFTIQVDDRVVIGTCNGFDIIEHVEGKIKVSTHFDQDGNLKMELNRFSVRHTFSNSETGDSLFTPDVGIDMIDLRKNSIAVVGIVGRIVVPGEGLVFAHLGRIVFDLDTGEVVFEAGPHDDFAELVPVLCSALE